MKQFPIRIVAAIARLEAFKVRLEADRTQMTTRKKLLNENQIRINF